MANRQYVGARYVPKFADPVEWNKALSYEALTIVTHLGNSFTSKKPVPAGIDIGNGEYWVNTGNYNEQIANYKAAVDAISAEIIPIKNSVVNVVEAGVANDGTDCTTALQNVLNNNIDKTVFIPDGVYVISSPINVSMSAHIVMSDGAEITSNTTVPALIKIGGGYSVEAVDVGGSFSGGTLNAKNADVGMWCDSLGPLFNVSNVSIVNAKTGMKFNKNANFDSGSYTVQNIKISGAGSGLNTKGLLIDSDDNNFNNIFICHVKVGVEITGWSSVLTNIHCVTGKYANGQPTVEEWAGGIGFNIANNGLTKLTNCYADTFEHGFNYTTTDMATGLIMDKCFTYYWACPNNANCFALFIKGANSRITMTNCYFNTHSNGQCKIVKCDDYWIEDYFHAIIAKSANNRIGDTNSPVTDLGYSVTEKTSVGYPGGAGTANLIYPVCCFKVNDRSTTKINLQMGTEFSCDITISGNTIVNVENIRKPSKNFTLVSCNPIQNDFGTNFLVLGVKCAEAFELFPIITPTAVGYDCVRAKIGLWPGAITATTTQQEYPIPTT